MQEQGRKIQQILKRKGLKQYLFVQQLGWHPSAFSKKVKAGEDFSPRKLQSIADALGVTTDFLENKEYVYWATSPIPEDAILAKTPPAKPTPDTDPVAALMILAQKQMQETRNELAQIDPEIMLQANREMIDAMNRLAVEMRELSQELRLTREGEPGEHHPD